MISRTFFQRLSGAASILALATLMLGACKSDPLSPGIEYMPDMYRSVAMRPYESSALFDDSLGMRPPVAGTITRGSNPDAVILEANMPYPYPDSPEGYELAGANLKNPLPLTPELLEQGKDLYGKFCVHCHGDAGNGDGSLVKNDKFPTPGTYASKVGLTEGKMFHSITYGKGLMGQHASQLNKQERWILVHYVQSLLNKATPASTASADTAKTKTAK